IEQGGEGRARLTAWRKSRQLGLRSLGCAHRLPGYLNDNESREDTMSELRGTLFGRCACCPPPMGRREFLAGGIAALGLGAFAAASNAAAQANPPRIDVHHHISPPSWLEAVKKAKRDNPPVVNWSPQKSLDDMDQAGIATAIVSPTTPQ